MDNLNNNEEIVEEQIDDDVLEDDDLLSLISGEEPANSNEDEEDDDEFDPKDGDSPEVLLTKLAATKRIVRQREKAIKRLQKEAGAQAPASTSQDELVQAILAAKGAPEESSEPQINMEQLSEQFAEDPSKIVEFMLAREQALEEKLANVLQRRDKFYENRFNESEMSKEPASIVTLAEKLGKLEQYNGFSESQLITVAKSIKPLGVRVKQAPAPTSSQNVPLNAPNAEVEKFHKSALAQMGYESD